MKKTYICATTAIFFWSTVAVAAKLLLGSFNNFQVLWISAFFAFIFLVLLNIINGNIKKLKEYAFRDYAISALIGLPGTFFYYVFYYAGTDMMPASQAFIVNYLWPIMSVLFACIILKEKLTFRKVLAILISFLGVGIVTGSSLAALNKGALLGSLFCMAGAVSYGIFTSLNQKFKYDKWISMMINYFVTFILTGIINFINGDLFLPSLSVGLGFVYNGVFTMAIANTMWNIALQSGNTAKISNLAYITPFASLIWTTIILKEPLSAFSFIGLAVIVSGIFIQIKEK